MTLVRTACGTTSTRRRGGSCGASPARSVGRRRARVGPGHRRGCLVRATDSFAFLMSGRAAPAGCRPAPPRSVPSASCSRPGSSAGPASPPPRPPPPASARTPRSARSTATPPRSPLDHPAEGPLRPRVPDQRIVLAQELRQQAPLLRPQLHRHRSRHTAHSVSRGQELCPDLRPAINRRAVVPKKSLRPARGPRRRLRGARHVLVRIRGQLGGLFTYSTTESDGGSEGGPGLGRRLGRVRSGGRPDAEPDGVSRGRSGAYRPMRGRWSRCASG